MGSSQWAMLLLVVAVVVWLVVMLRWLMVLVPLVSTSAQPDSAMIVIEAMDAAIQQVDTQRSDLGAIQNRLESTIRNQTNVSVNEADARSRIQMLILLRSRLTCRNRASFSRPLLPC